MIITNKLEEVVNAPFVNGPEARELGKFHMNSCKLFMKKATEPYGQIKDNTVTVLGVADAKFRDFLDNKKYEPSNVVRSYNLYGELLTSDLLYVTPIVSGKFKEVITQFSSIQRDKIDKDSQIVIQFTTGQAYTISKYDLTDIFIGALPDFIMRYFVTVFKQFNFESMQYLLEKGYLWGLGNIVDTIGTLNLAFKPEQIQWMRTKLQL